MSDLERYDEIKRRMRRDNALFLAILTVLGVLAIFVYWLNINRMAFYTLIIVIVAFAAIGVWRNLMVPEWSKNWSKYVQDERMKRINASEISQSWTLTGLIVVVIMLLVLLKIVDLGTYPSLIIVYLVMMYSWFFFRWYYGRKGDVL